MKIQNATNPNITRNIRQVPKEYLEVAKGMDAQFMEHLFQEMEKTVPHEEQESTAQEIYRSLLNHERAKTIAERNEGQGIQKLILDEIAPKQQRRF